MSDVTYLKPVEATVARKQCARCQQSFFADAVRFRWVEHPRKKICLECFETVTREYAEYRIAIAREMSSPWGD